MSGKKSAQSKARAKRKPRKAVPPEEKPLTAQQTRFADLYIQTLDHKHAAKEAGYKDWQRAGYKLKDQPHINAYIMRGLAAAQKRTQIDKDYVVASAVEVVERCKQARPVLNRDGTPVMVETANGTELVPAYTFDAGNALRGLAFLTKLLGIADEDEEAEKVKSLTGFQQMMTEVMNRETSVPVVMDPRPFTEFEKEQRARRDATDAEVIDDQSAA
jgi:phage terminase small subunit